MGLFFYLVDRFECVRCRRVSNVYIQNKLLRHEADNSSREYRVGDVEKLVGLDDYCPLDPWDGRSPLVVAIGDWDCEHCRLNWQWARATFELQPASGDPIAILRELINFQPRQPSDLIGVHYAESELAELSGFWTSPPGYNWQEGFERWTACPLAQRREHLAAGYRQWYREFIEGQPGTETNIASR